MTETRIALVGAGFMADAHLDAYRQLPNVRVAAVVSPSSAATFVDDRDVAADAYDDLSSALADTTVDAVDVCTPTPTHPSLVREAVAAGFPVLCEKPLANSMSEAVALRDDLADVDVPIMVGHVVRFFPQYAAAKRQVDAGRIGTPGVARVRRLSPFPDWADWYADRDRSGGVFLDLAIHDLDYLRWTFGAVESVFARLTREDGFEHGTATLAFENGATGYVEASWGQPQSRGLSVDFELAGDDGVVVHEDATGDPVRVFTNEGERTLRSTETSVGYVEQAAHFIDCVRTGDAPLVGLEQAAAAVRLSEAARRSADRGEPVSVAEVQA